MPTAPPLFILAARVDAEVSMFWMILFGIICAFMAANRGRSTVGWFFIGFFTMCIGFILILVLPDLKTQELKDRRVALENRRLREQLSKERQVSDQRHGLIEKRLGVHDEALGIDTATPPELQASATPAQLTDGEQWFYARDGERKGPVSTETIFHLLEQKLIDTSTLVWINGMEDWAPVSDVDPFRGDRS